MAILKTYLLAPNFTTHLDGNVQLGTVIQDPFRPNKWLAKIPLSLDVDTHVEYDCSISPGTSASTHMSVFAKFFETASANTGLRTDKSVINHHAMDTLETITYKRDITDEEAADFVQANKNIQDAMHSGVLGFAPVYVVTGLKIAKGFNHTTEITKSNEVTVGASMPIIEQISAGADLGFSRGKTLNEQSSTTQDIIFAYQLHAIATRGWRRKRIAIDLWADKAAALGKESGSVKPDDAIAVASATTEDIEQSLIDYEDVDIVEHQVDEGETPCVCIAFTDVAE